MIGVGHGEEIEDHVLGKSKIQENSLALLSSHKTKDTR
jgi:hypothetical protein